MAATYSLISSTTLSSTAASVTFSGIPNIYNDLILRCSIRDTQSAEYVSAFLRANSITTGYSYTYLRNNGATTASGLESGQTSFIVANNNANTSSGSVFANLEIYIPNYANSTYKSIYADNAAENTTTSPVYRWNGAGVLSNTAAITSLTMLASTAFATESSFALYGLKA